MKITDVKTVLLTGPSSNDPFIKASRGRRSAAFIEIHTDQGLVGLGETYGGYFFPEAVPTVVDFFRPILVGQDPSIISELYARMYQCGNFWCRVGLGSIVITGIEAALWDLRGKALNQPAHELLGGCKHKHLLGYATGGHSNYPKKRLAEQIDFYLSEGFRAFKVGAGSWDPGAGGWYMPEGASAIAAFEADKVKFMRQHVGPDVAILMDGHMGNSPSAPWTLEIARAVMQEMAPHKLFLYEEPLHYTDPAGYSELCRISDVPIAGGECLSAPCEWQTFIERDCFDIGQPDASFVGGLEPFMRVANWLHQRGRKIATHAWGAGGSLMQNIHCAFAAANAVILEIPAAMGPLHSEIVGDSFRMKDGQVLPPTTPGLGIRLTDDIKKCFAFVPGSGEFNDVPGKLLRD